MAITSAEIHNQSFSIDRKGYDVDEVDVFLEHVADEIDSMNATIAELENQLDDGKFDGFDTPARPIEAPAAAPADDGLLAEKDERIAELERQLEAKKADDNAIAQALIIAQRSADEIIANANAQSAATIKDGEEEAERILAKAEAEKQKVLDAIKKLEDDREDAREDYQELLTDFITDATRKLAEIGGSMPAPALTSAHARPAASAAQVEVEEAAYTTSPAQAPINRDGAGAYSMPQATGAVVAPATPKPSGFEKDLSGFGDADDAFEFEEID
ncbi:DivIVA domain-containing protein [Arabiibacter massiliensis]|uniref:DivIVA domain-containing protein n=1 Tax=Arabiibacter massiliensis TaxID=1870985 RepID=UPI0009BB0632|nr:DivIVA domain-containing protein [Arabiibacter massiliensis]